MTMNQNDIDLAADRLGYDLGWRFMMCPESTMRTATVAIVVNRRGARAPIGALLH
jgi:hypothetical protein